jgi:3-methyl-2-oxobutanoate hydroxymethyltransferase
MLDAGAALDRAVERIVATGIPVMGHLGLTPQSIHQFGSYQVRGTEAKEAEEIKADARALEEAGAFAIVLEKVPDALGRAIARERKVPVIGIGAGSGCDGQILVTHDMLGLYTRFHPRFVRRYAKLGAAVREAFERYATDVKGRDFPSKDESY